jgi:DNA mismatch repair ATPase MutS
MTLMREDARTLGKALGHAPSTWRDANTVGFHANYLESSLRKLLHAGHRVAICDQLEPAVKPMRMEVNRIVTPGAMVTIPAEENEPVEEKPGTLTFIGKSGNRTQVPWMFD